MRVDELLGVVVALLKSQLTNAGNGGEAFALSSSGTGGGDDLDPTITGIAVDANGNGAYDAGVDTPYVSGSDDPVLAPDASVAVFLLSSVPANGADAARGYARLIASAATGVTFVKSASVVDPFGGTRAVPGSVISYKLVTTLSGSGSLTNLRLSDAIPVGTTYKPGSLSLDGAGLTDAAGMVAVTLPTTAAAGSNYAVGFKVTINQGS